jgi:6-phospho-beta-glucosidase
MDINAEKLALIGALCRHLVDRAGSPVSLTTTGDAHHALDGAAYIVTTIRVAEEQGRVYDERIALHHGVLGQETTGPGGFAMAMRSIPAILDYAGLAARLSPQAWLLNFTNPAGLVTQALHARGFARAVGICDGANQARMESARWLGIPPESLRAEVFGLNHLSWTRSLLREDKDILPGLLADDAFLAGTSQRMFAPELVRSFGMWLNEYLYYYYYTERALAAIQADQLTRGEEVLRLNRDLLEALRAVDPRRNPAAALRAYAAYERRRVATYMHYAYADSPSIAEADRSKTDDLLLTPEEGEGYAGVALDIIQAFETTQSLHTALNIPNQGAIDCLPPDDIVEISCRVEAGAIHPLAIGAIPEAQEMLMRSVKLYERLAVQAILERSRQKAVMALMSHPLVLSHSRAQALLSEYLVAHAAFIGEWH